MKLSARARRDLQASGLFDRDWYLATYPDVEELGLDPLDHFLWLGHRLGRNPGPAFDTDAYLNRYRDVRGAAENPVLHYIRHGKDEGRKITPVPPPPPAPPRRAGHFDFPMTRLSGHLNRMAGRATVLLCAHIVGSQLYGSERSLLDMLRGLRAMGLNVVITAPPNSNAPYMEMLRGQACAVISFDYGWWRAGHPVDETAVASFAQIIADERIDIVHANTIMLREPLIAARRMGIPAVLHARELISHDQKLLELIGEPSDRIVDQLWDNADAIIANSQATAACFDRGDRRCSVVYNTADMDDLLALAPPMDTGPLRVGLISSNVPKKGIFDFAAIARQVSARRDDVVFHLIGPEHEHTEAFATQLAEGSLPDSFRILGYRDTPAEAVAETDVVLSISNFQESFGRTVLEAMAGGRPAIVYRYGAPPELVDEGKTGHVVPLGDTQAVTDRICAMAEDRRSMLVMGQRARTRAREIFGEDAYAAAMQAAYAPLLDDTGHRPARMVLPARALPDRVPRDRLRVAYFCWHFPVPSETFVLNELRLLKAQGIDVTVFCKQSPYPEFEPDFDITWERVRDADHLAQRLTETGRNIVHAHFIYPTVTDMVWPACEAAQIPFTCIAHAQDIFRYRNAAANRIDEFSRSPLCRRIFTLSRFHRQYLVDRGVVPGKLAINSNCIDPDLFAEGKVDDRPARTRRAVCAVSRFADKKGLEHLVAAGRYLADEDVHINVYGYGPMEQDYRDIIEREGLRNVTIHGPVKGREALLEVFRDHDLFVCPSVRAPDGDMDGIPTTILESMAAGLPVLATAISGIPDLVRDGVTGLICTASPQDIAAKIRRYYGLPDLAVRAMIEDAEAQLRRNHHGAELVNTLLRVWAEETVDLMIVAWNNLPQTSEVIRRLYEFTALPFHLIICDNGSDAPALAHHLGLYARHGNVTLILNRENAYVGPGTNMCIDQGASDYMIYVCGKEGMVTNHGWEKSFVSYMDAHPRVGLAGTLCYSPSYLHGRDYPTGVPVFDKFRNRDFAERNPDRRFAHVQGGFFAIRRSAYEEIGGYSEDVYHGHTDVEYSYYMESCGWELGEIPKLMALFNKTRPGLAARVDEHHAALHPPELTDLPWLDRIARRETRHCNLCETSFAAFEGGDSAAVCPNCGSTRRARSLHRLLAESTLLYRRLPGLGVGLPAALQTFWSQQFQGPMLPTGEFATVLSDSGRLPNADGGLHLACLNDVLDNPELRASALSETARLLAPEATLIVAGTSPAAELQAPLAAAGFTHVAQHRYSSEVLRFDWSEIGLYHRAPAV